MWMGKLARLVLRLSWIALFLLAFGFAVKNGQNVAISYYLGHRWEVPLALALLAAFVAGVLAGIAAGLATVVRQKREILALERELNARAADEAARRQQKD